MHTIDTDIPSSLHRIRAASILLVGVVRLVSDAEESERRCCTTAGAFVGRPRTSTRSTTAEGSDLYGALLRGLLRGNRPSWCTSVPVIRRDLGMTAGTDLPA